MNYYMQLLHKDCSISIEFDFITTNLYTIKYCIEFTEQSFTVKPKEYIKSTLLESNRFDLDLVRLGIKLNDCEVKQELISY